VIGHEHDPKTAGRCCPLLPLPPTAAARCCRCSPPLLLTSAPWYRRKKRVQGSEPFPGQRQAGIATLMLVTLGLVSYSHHCR
jgi:hypothetical protein